MGIISNDKDLTERERKEFVCAQDLREEELKKQGKTYFRIGRAIFVIERVERDEVTTEEVLGTPLGVAVALGPKPETVADPEFKRTVNELFLPTGYLKITVEGDPDAGLDLSPNIIQLTGYRFGLDDVIVDGKLLDTTHGNSRDIMRNFADWFETNDSWAEIHRQKRLAGKFKRIADEIRAVAEEMDKLET